MICRLIFCVLLVSCFPLQVLAVEGDEEERQREQATIEGVEKLDNQSNQINEDCDLPRIGNGENNQNKEQLALELRDRQADLKQHVPLKDLKNVPLNEYSPCCSPDGKYLVTIDYQNNQLKLRDPKTQEIVHTFQNQGDFAFSCNGKRLAVGNEDKFEIWSLEPFKHITTLDNMGKPANCISSLEGDFLVSEDYFSPNCDKYRKLWNIKMGTVRCVSCDQGNRLKSAILSPDGLLLVCTLLTVDNKTNIIFKSTTNEESSMLLGDLTIHRKSYRFNQSGTKLYFKNIEGVYRIDLNTKTLHQFLAAPNLDVWDYILSHDETMLAIGQGGNIRLFDKNDNEFHSIPFEMERDTEWCCFNLLDFDRNEIKMSSRQPGRLITFSLYDDEEKSS